MLAELLDVAEDRPGCFTALLPPPGRPPRLFGGLVAAQALVAGARTVPPAREPHSMHLYFQRPGRLDVVPELEVERVRDGRAFSLRRVVVRQSGKEILSATVSFTEPVVDSFDHPGDEPIDVVAPESLPEYTASGHARYFEVRTDLTGRDPAARWRFARLWARARDLPASDPVLASAVVVYLSDTAWAYGGLGLGGPSLDHAVWFHRPTRADAWHLVDVGPASAHGGRGLYTGTVHDRDGRRIATLAQEALLAEA